MDEAVISPINGFVSTAHRLLASGMDINALRTNALLQKDEWKRLDDTVIAVARGRLNGIADLQNAGLSKDMGGLGVLLAEYEKVSDMEPAQQSLSGVTEGEEDIPAFTLAGVPIPITHKDFRVNIRHLEASRTRGQSIDTTAANLASRLVVEKLEDMLFNGSTVSFGSNTIPGYLTFADRETGSLTAAWSTAGTTGEQILTDTIAMIKKSEDNNFFGPWTMYVPQGYMPKLRGDFKANSDKTIMQRLMEIQGLTAIKPTSKLTGNNVVLVQLTEDVVDLPVGQDLTVVEWEQKGGLELHFKVMTALVPRIKSDANGQCGLVHFSV